MNAADLDGKLRELLQPLKDACDRSWEDETPEQIVSIAASAIYWRDQEIENLRHNAAPRRAGVFDEADLAKAAALGRVEGLKAAELACLEYRCVRGTPWDLAVLACVEAIRALKVNQ